MSKTSAAAAKALTSDFFALFGLAPAFALDIERLDAVYRDIQSRVHPDRHAQASESERRASMQMAARVNEAHRTLKDPVRRAQYLLELNGVDVGFETNTAMPPEFLMEQMELREALEGARDAAALGVLEKVIFEKKRGLEAQIAHCADVAHDYTAAAGPVRKLMFLERLDEEVNAAYEAFDG